MTGRAKPNGYRILRSTDADTINLLQRILRKSDGLPIIGYEGRQWWVAWRQGYPVGYCAVRMFDDFAWLSICGVVEEHRGNGLQKRMIIKRVQYAEEHGASVVYTYTINGNHPSSNSLIRTGFRLCDPEEKHYGAWAGEKDVLYWARYF